MLILGEISGTPENISPHLLHYRIITFGCGIKCNQLWSDKPLSYF